MNISTRLNPYPSTLAKLVLLLVLATLNTALAGSATWKQNPTSGDWNTAANWTPTTVPNDASDTATFATSNTTQVSVLADTDVAEIKFDPGASAFTVSVSAILRFDSAGVVNNSGIIQNFVASASPGFIAFNNNSSAGNMTTFTFAPGGFMVIGDFASAGKATFLMPANPVRNTNGGLMLIGGTAADATFTINGGAIRGAGGGFVLFEVEATADHAVFMVNGGTGDHAIGGEVFFEQRSTAADATLIANGGSNGGLGGTIIFFGAAHGARARVELFGNGELDISGHSSSNVAIGSIEGDGNVFLGSNNLTVGSNSLSTTFSGAIRDGGTYGGAGGSMTKIGSSKLVLRHRHTYTGGTTVEHGKLIINNLTGSGTGTGAVQVEGGELGGEGTIAGAVTVGRGSGTGAVLSPGIPHGIGRAGALTIQSPLTFNSDGIYQMELNSTSIVADQTAALGVTINSGAQFAFSDIGSDTLPIGTVFIVIKNTSANPIAGTFGNLPDGSSFTSNGNTYKVNYEGGDGNELTLRVVR